MDDAASVIQYAKELSYVDQEKVIVCGYSEGAMIATLLSAQESTAGLLPLGGAMLNAKWNSRHFNRLQTLICFRGYSSCGKPYAAEGKPYLAAGQKYMKNKWIETLINV